MTGPVYPPVAYHPATCWLRALADAVHAAPDDGARVRLIRRALADHDRVQAARDGALGDRQLWMHMLVQLTRLTTRPRPVLDAARRLHAACAPARDRVQLGAQ